MHKSYWTEKKQVEIGIGNRLAGLICICAVLAWVGYGAYHLFTFIMG